MQVIRQLRSGVQLRKVEWDAVHPRAEYALTPYEILMNDIKSKSKNLRHVDQENVALLRRVKKDAHELILEFIRSRPPLVPLSRRAQPPIPTKRQTAYEKLMHSIRQKPELKPTPRPSRRESSLVVGRVLATDSGKKWNIISPMIPESLYCLRRFFIWITFNSLPFVRDVEVRYLGNFALKSQNEFHSRTRACQEFRRQSLNESETVVVFWKYQCKGK